MSKSAFKTITITVGPKFYFTMGFVCAFAILLVVVLLFSKPIKAEQVIAESLEKMKNTRYYSVNYSSSILTGKLEEYSQLNLSRSGNLFRTEINGISRGTTFSVIVYSDLANHTMIGCVENECVGYNFENAPKYVLPFEEISILQDIVQNLTALKEELQKYVSVEVKTIASRPSYCLSYYNESEGGEICLDKEIGVPLLFKYNNALKGENIEVIANSVSLTPVEIELPLDVFWILVVGPSDHEAIKPRIEKVSCSEDELILNITGSPDKTYYLSFLQQENVTSDKFAPNIVLHGLPDTSIEPNFTKIIEINFSIDEWRIMDEIIIPIEKEKIAELRKQWENDSEVISWSESFAGVRIDYRNGTSLRIPYFEKKYLPHTFIKGSQIKIFFCESPYFNDCIKDWGNELFGIRLDKTYYTFNTKDYKFFIC